MKILIVKLWGIGELVMATPLIRNLKNYYKSSEITVLTGNTSADILEGNPDINRIISIDENIFKKKRVVEIFKLILRLKKYKFDSVILLHFSPFLSLFCYLINIKKRIGLKRPQQNLSFNNNDVLVNFSLHRIEQYHQVLKKINIPVNYSAPIVFETQKGKYEIKDLDLNSQPVIVISPTGNNSFMISENNKRKKAFTKLWPIENYVKLIEMFKTEFEKVSIIVVGGYNELKFSDYIEENCKIPVVNLINKISLQGLIALLKKTNLMITNDSGPMHIGNALNINMITIFGPTDPGIVGPLSNNSVILLDKKDCSPCFDEKTFPVKYKNCTKKYCLTSITPENVIQTIKTHKII